MSMMFQSEVLNELLWFNNHVVGTWEAKPKWRAVRVERERHLRILI